MRIQSRYASTIALFEGSTSFGEAVAAHAAILRIEARHGVTYDQGGSYFRLCYEPSYELTAEDVLTTAVLFGFDNGLSDYAELVTLASFATPALLGAAQRLYLAKGVENERAWNLLESARSFWADMEAIREVA